MKIKDTLNLGKTAFPMRAGLPSKEPVWQKAWQEAAIYQKRQELNEGKPAFHLHDGPPYANGNIHVGHALNKISKDIIVRSKSMSGYQAPAPAQASSVTQSSQSYSTAAPMVQEVTKAESPGRTFEKDYGTDANFTGLVPYAAFRQFAAEQTAPEALREASNMMRGYDLGRIRSGSTARPSGYEEYMRSQLLNDIDRMQKEMAEPYYQTATDRYTDWLKSQKLSYETDPAYQLQKYVNPDYPGMSFQVKKGLNQAIYNPHDLSQYFTSGYNAPVDWNKLYGTIT